MSALHWYALRCIAVHCCTLLLSGFRLPCPTSGILLQVLKTSSGESSSEASNSTPSANTQMCIPSVQVCFHRLVKICYQDVCF